MADQETIDTYNQSAELLQRTYADIKPRIEHIDRTFGFINTKDPSVVELGCAHGREAGEILKRAKSYIGVDISSVFVEMAKKDNPTGHFAVADMAKFEWPIGVDVVFAFASMLHLNIEEFQKVLTDAHRALRENGIFYFSIKSGPDYTSEQQVDAFGTRVFYYYSFDRITELVKGLYDIEWNYEDEYRSQAWLYCILRKK